MNPMPVSLLILCMALGGCDQNEAGQTGGERSSAQVDRSAPVALVNIAPGGIPPDSARAPSAKAAGFDGNSDQIAAGRQLYLAYNCIGCHFNGGGGMGPALMDDDWVYGSGMENIAATIKEGRPNGMPSFRAVVTEDQVWQLAAYVRSLSHLPDRGEAAR
jgi:cytochrome c oxidase cbb3-type subunit 3